MLLGRVFNPPFFFACFQIYCGSLREVGFVIDDTIGGDVQERPA